MNENEGKYQQLIKHNNFIVRDHRVFNIHTLPGVALLDIIYRLTYNNLAMRNIELKDIVFHQPVVTTETSYAELIISILPKNTYWKVSIKSSMINNNTQLKSDFRLNMECRLYEIRNAVTEKTIDYKKIIANSKVRFDMDEIYSIARQANINHYSFMKTIGTVYQSDNEEIMKLMLSDFSEKYRNYFYVHPAFLDASTFSGMSFRIHAQKSSSPTNESPYIPLAIERFCIYNPLSQIAYTYSKLDNENNGGSVLKSPDVFSNDISILDSNGQILVEFEKLTFKKIREPGLFKQLVQSNKNIDKKASLPQSVSTKENFISYIRSEIAHILKKQSHEIDIKTGFYNLGLDSTQLMGLVKKLEDKLNVQLYPTLLFEYSNIERLADYFHNNPDTTLSVGSTQTSLDNLNSKAMPTKDKDLLNTITVPIVSHEHASPGTEINRPDEMAVIGISGRYPQAENLDQFYQNLRDGRDCITAMPKERWKNYPLSYDIEKIYNYGGFLNSIDTFDPLFFNLSPRYAEIMDPQARLFIEIAWEACVDAGLPLDKFEHYYPMSSNRSVGVFTGVFWNHYELFGAELTKDGYEASFGIGSASIPNMVSYCLNFHGPSLAVDTMCSSSLTAIHLACESIRNSECQYALAGGVNLVTHPHKYLFLKKAEFLASDGKCRSFGDGGDGYVPGEGVGAVLITTLERAQSEGYPIYAIIKGSALNHVGRTSGVSVPDPIAQSEVITRALFTAKVDPLTINYLEAHGTGTSLGDPIEIQGLNKAYSNQNAKKQYCAIGSVKSNIGHLEAASGIAGITKLLLQMKYKEIFPTLHTSKLNPHIPFDQSPFYVECNLKKWHQISLLDGNSEKLSPRRAGISSFGANGSNAHIILEEYDSKILSSRPIDVNYSNSPLIIPLSSKNEKHLRQYILKILDYFNDDVLDSINFEKLLNLSYTLQVGREEMDYRIALVIQHPTEIKNKLQAYIDGQKTIENCYYGNATNEREIINLFSSNEDVETVIQRWVIQKKYDSIALLWVKGYPVDWKMIYNGQTPKRISLPSPPLSRKRYWIPFPPKTDEAHTRAGKLHPFIDANTSTLQKQQYLLMLNGDECYIADHIIGNKKVLPGVIYIEMARAAGELAGENKVQKLKNIVFSQPVIFTKKEKTCLTVGLYPETDCVKYEIITIPKDNNKIIHSQGTIFYSDDHSTQHEIDIKEIKNRCSNCIDNKTFYGIIKSRGFDYGSSLQAIQELYHNSNEALSFLRIAPFLRDEFDDFLLHPTLLDGALQTAIGIFVTSDCEDKTVYSPFCIGEVKLLNALNRQCYVHATYIENSNEKQIKKINIDILDDSGKKLIIIKNFTVRALKQAYNVPPDPPKTSSEIMYFRKEWKPVKKDDKKSDYKNLRFLVFDTNQELMKRISTSLKDRYEQACSINCVLPASEFSRVDNDLYTIKPDEPNDYVTLLQSLKHKRELPNRIIYAWTGNNEEYRLMQKKFSNSIYSISFLVKELSLLNSIRNVKMVYLINERNGVINPEYLALSGFAQTMRHENPSFTCKIIRYISASALPVNRLLDEFLYSDGTDVTLSDGTRHLLRLKEWTPPNHADISKTLFKENGVYLITGGAKGLGLIFSEYIANSSRCELVITGRSEISENRNEELNKITRNGSHIKYIQSNVTNYDEVKDLIATIKKLFGRIDGIIHCAGVIRDSFLINKTSEEISAVISPKVDGTIHLDEITKNEQLDFFILFSSIAAIFGNAGQADYSYANSFLDNFASKREQLRHEGKRCGKTISINWPYWKNGGMKMDANKLSIIENVTGMQPLLTKEGLDAFEYILHCSGPQVSVIKGNRKKIFTVIEAMIEKDEKEIPDATFKKMDDEKELVERVTDDVLQIIQDLLKIDKEDIDVNVDIQEFGFDSIGLTELGNKLNEKFRLDITPAMFFEFDNPTIAALVRYLVQENTNRLLDFYNDKCERPIIENTPSKDSEIIDPLPTRPLVQPVVSGSDRKSIDESIAIIGMSGIMPQSQDLDTFWEQLDNGKDLISEIPSDRWDWRETYRELGSENRACSKWGGFMDDVDTFDADFFNITPREATLMDPQQRLFLQTVWKTIEDAGYKASDLSGSATGLFVGVASLDYYDIVLQNLKTINPYSLTGLSHSILANRISYYFNFHGPSEAIDTACSSSLIAIHRAVEAIKCGSCTTAIAGGVNTILSPRLFISLSVLGLLSKDGKCKTFDKDANGYVRGEGVGAIMLKPLKDALSHGDNIYAVIKGSAENHGGRSHSLTAPNANAQAKLIKDAMRRGNVAPQSISYIEVHGTGTSLGDPIEVNGLKKSFEQLSLEHSNEAVPKKYCGIGSVKTNIGHLETAAGIAGVLKVLLSMKNKRIPPSINLRNINPYLNLTDSPFYIVEKSQPWNRLKDNENNEIPRRAGISSFGFGGANAHLILEEYNSIDISDEYANTSSQLIIVSGRNAKILDEYLQNLRKFIDRCIKSKGHSPSLIEIAYTLQVGREAFDERIALVVNSMEALSEKLNRLTENCNDVPHVFRGNNAKKNINIQSLLIDDDGDDGQEFLKQIITTKNLKKLAMLWVSGIEIDWSLLHSDTHVKRVPLPGYPFEKKRYWINEKKTPESVQKMLYQKIWINQPLSTTPNTCNTPMNENKIVIMYSSPMNDIARTLHCDDTSDNVIRIQLPECTSGNRPNIESIIQSLTNPGAIDTIYFLGGITEHVDILDLGLLDGINYMGVYVLFELIQWLHQNKALETVINLKVVTNRNHAVSGAETILPFGADVAALAVTAAKEYQNLNVACMDIEYDSGTSETSIETIVNAIQKEPVSKTGTIIAFRKGERFIATESGLNKLKSVSQNPKADTKDPVCEFNEEECEVDYIKIVKKMITKYTGNPLHTFSSETEFNELGIDSIVGMQLIQEIEIQHGLRIYPNELIECNTVGKLAAYLQRELGSPIDTCQDNSNKMSEKPPIFLLSAPRSGSTLLRVMLAGHSAIFAPPELHLLPFDNLKQRIEILRNSKQDFLTEGLIEAVMELESLPLKQAQEYVAQLEEKELSIKKTYEYLHKKANGRYILDKSPSYGQNVQTLQNAESVCQKPLFVFLTRHPISVMESFVRNRFNKLLGVKGDPWKISEEIWTTVNRNISSFLSKIPRNRRFQIQYEELVKNPEKTMRELCSFLNIPFEISLLSPYEGNRMVSGLHKGVSITIGDPNFLNHNNIDADLANVWKKYIEKASTLSSATVLLTRQIGYDTTHFLNNKLTPSQEMFLRENKEEPIWHIIQHISIEASSGFHPKQFQTDLRNLLNQHSVFKKYFRRVDGTWTQYEQENVSFEVPYYDISELDNIDQKQRIIKIERHMNKKLQIDCAPLFQCVVVKTDLSTHRIIFVVHHLISDGVTLSLLNRSLFNSRSKQVKLKGKTELNYNDFIQTIDNIRSGKEISGHKNFWKKHVGQIKMQCPIDSENGENIFSSEKSFSTEVTFQELNITTVEQKNELFNYLNIGLYRYLHIWTGIDSPILIHRIHRRNIAHNQHFTNVMGWFAGDVPLMFPISSNDSTQKQLANFSKLFRSIPAGGLSYDILANSEQLPPTHEVSPIRLNFQPYNTIENISVTDSHIYQSPNNNRLFLIDFIAREIEGRLFLLIRYSNNFHTLRTAKSLIKGWIESTRAVTD